MNFTRSPSHLTPAEVKSPAIGPGASSRRLAWVWEGSSGEVTSPGQEELRPTASPWAAVLEAAAVEALGVAEPPCGRPGRLCRLLLGHAWPSRAGAEGTSPGVIGGKESGVDLLVPRRWL